MARSLDKLPLGNISVKDDLFCASYLDLSSHVLISPLCVTASLLLSFSLGRIFTLPLLERGGYVGSLIKLGINLIEPDSNNPAMQKGLIYQKRNCCGGKLKNVIYLK